MTTPKKIGIIGGADPAASCLLYKKIIDECLLRTNCFNGSDFPEIIIINFPFTRGMSAAGAHQAKNVLCIELQLCIDKLVLCDVDIIAIACNTLHLFVPFLKLYDKQFVHIVQTVLERVEKTSSKKILVLATGASIEQRLYQHATRELVTPLPKHQKAVDNIIKKIHAGSYCQADANSLQIIAQSVPIDGIILGCTDLPVLHERFPIAHGMLIFDSVQIFAEELVKQAFSKGFFVF